MEEQAVTNIEIYPEDLPYPAQSAKRILELFSGPARRYCVRPTTVIREWGDANGSRMVRKQRPGTLMAEDPPSASQDT